ncbi:helix-turn-helix domain-containing protein [Limnochorda pilosa]|uniref:AraC family transcriptional regulator n=1 Tax=Limnochorda pilosa TaxID=1555112 RepID=A0A0K2SJ97_LIMPI|nr:helix-turn-helix domain-containing protein [Limnochorda pilosa]BAS27191.1 AraC family transcriptional regulator [Limnochorda pilosa]
MFDGAVLNRLRIEQGISLKRLAARCGTSASYLSEVERGLKQPSPTVVDRVAGALGVAPDAFYPDAPAPASIGRMLKEERRGRGLSLEEAARRAELPARFLRQVEESAITPSVDVIESLAGALGIPLERLYGGGGALAGRVRALRAFWGLTQAELAERAQVSAGLIGQIERGETLPSLRTIERLAEVLRCSPCTLLLSPASSQADVQAALSPALRRLLADPERHELLCLISSLDARELEFFMSVLRLARQAGLVADSLPDASPGARRYTAR